MTTTAPDPTASTGSAHSAQRPGSALSATLSLTLTGLLSFVREPVAFVFGALYPLFMLVLFNAVFPGEIGAGVTFGDYMLPAMVATGVLMSCTQVLAIFVASERESGELKRLSVLPVPSWAYVVAKCLFGIILSVINVVVLMLVGRLVLGLALPGSPGAWGLMMLSLVLTVAMCTAWALAIGRMCSSSRAASGIMTPMVIILMFVSGLALPLSQLPTWMVDVFSVLPVRWSGGLMRQAFLPSGFAELEPTGTWETSKGLAVITAWFVAGVVSAVVVARRDTVDR